jgi:hypothetical protein
MDKYSVFEPFPVVKHIMFTPTVNFLLHVLGPKTIVIVIKVDWNSRVVE